MSAFDPRKHLRTRRWLTVLTATITAAIALLLADLIELPLTVFFAVGMVGATAFISYRHGVEDMAEIWDLRETGHNAKPYQESE